MSHLYGKTQCAPPDNQDLPSALRAGNYFERCLFWNLKPNSGLIAADPKSVDRKLCDAKRVFRARFSLDGAATRAAESGEGGHSTTVVTVNDTPSRDFAHILHFHLANPASRRIARRSGVYGDRAERLNPNIWFSSRDSYQRSEKTPINGLG